MHITQDFGSLLAQVFSTLLVAYLIESRVRPARSRARTWRRGFPYVRVVTVVMTVVSTFACLFVAGTGRDVAFIDGFVSATIVVLLIAFVELSARIVDEELLR